MSSIAERAERNRFAQACESLVAGGHAIELLGGAVKIIVADPEAVQRDLEQVDMRYGLRFDELSEEHDGQDREAWKRLVEEYPELKRSMTVTPDRFIPDQGWRFPGDD